MCATTRASNAGHSKAVPSTRSIRVEAGESVTRGATGRWTAGPGARAGLAAGVAGVAGAAGVAGVSDPIRQTLFHEIHEFPHGCPFLQVCARASVDNPRPIIKMASWAVRLCIFIVVTSCATELCRRRMTWHGQGILWPPAFRGAVRKARCFSLHKHSRRAWRLQNIGVIE